MKSTITIDWFSCSCKNVPVLTVIEKGLQIDKDNFTAEDKGINRYTHCYSYGDIKVYYNNFMGDDHMGVFVQLTGAGCGQYTEFFQSETNNWSALFTRFIDYFDAKFTRIDLASDFYTPVLNINKMFRYTIQGLLITRARNSCYHRGILNETGATTGETLEIGVKGGNGQQFCVYDKLLEQHIQLIDPETGKSVNDWIRAELRYFGKKSVLIARLIKKNKPLKDIFFEEINGNYRFVVPNSSDSKKNRRPSVRWWTEFVKTTKKTTLKVERPKKTLKDTEKWIDKQVSRSLGKIYLAHKESFGEEAAREYVNSLVKNGLAKLTDSDCTDISQYKLEKTSKPKWG